MGFYETWPRLLDLAMRNHVLVLRGKQDEKSTSIRMRKCRRMRDEVRA
jgi:hypothetical protein